MPVFRRVAYAAGPRPEDIRTATAAEMLTAWPAPWAWSRPVTGPGTPQRSLRCSFWTTWSRFHGEQARLGNFLRQLGGRAPPC